MSKQIYCPSMWKSIHVDTDGYLTPCCLFIHEKDKRFKITDVEHVEDVLVNDFKQYRQQLSSGEWPSGCNQCKFAEEEGRASKRQQDMWVITSGIMTSPPERVSLEYLQLKTGRLCNLRCTICTPACSTSIATQLLKEGKLSRKMYDKYQKQIEWSYNLDEYKKLNSETGYFRIDIAGGEPLMNKTHFKWLDQLDNTKNTQLLYNTNGTHVPSREEIEIWKKFRGIWLTFSIDSYGEKFEQLRVGAKWDQVIDNLKYCQEEIVAKEFNLNTTNCSVVTTVSRLNVSDVFELYKIIMDKITFNHDNPLNFNYLFYPEHLACHNMSKNELKEVIKLYDKNIPKLNSKSKMYRQSLDLRNSLITFVNDKKMYHDRKINNDHRHEMKHN
jgi:radical SAM protein with 4Fe4S-binding SPASM domain